MRLGRVSSFRLIVALTASAMAGSAQVTLTQLHLFPEPGPSAPECTLVETSPGVFYGTTSTSSGGPPTIFQVTRGGAFQVVHTFLSSEGDSPIGALIQAQDGFAYGVTIGGGRFGEGTVYRTDPLASDPAGNVNVIVDFIGTVAEPFSLIQAGNGRLYGTVSGTPSFVYFLAGNDIKPLHVFSAEEGSPAGPLIQAANGNFYGLTSAGIYELTALGGFNMLHVFSGNDGSSPAGNLSQGDDGRLYGVNAFGGANNYGTVFSISKGGSFRVDHAFQGPPADGFYPFTGTARANDGNIYGTSATGLFRVSPGAGYESLVQFPSTIPGGNPSFPSPAVVQGSDGYLYGVQTTLGGSVYQIDAGLQVLKPSAIQFSPASGAAGAMVKILGDHFLGATAVSFNGALAQYEVTSAGSIFAKVPAGATTGPIGVLTPNGSANSTLDFTVQ